MYTSFERLIWKILVEKYGVLDLEATNQNYKSCFDFGNVADSRQEIRYNLGAAELKKIFDTGNPNLEISKFRDKSGQQIYNLK